MSEPSYKCPQCGGSNFKRWELPHPVILHWILNPGAVFNELVLGQRLPKISLICQDCEGPLLDRGYTPCPSCGAMHLGRLSSGKEAFFKWRGASCPSCGEAIPCLWNVFSLLLLLVTFPIWSLPYFLYFRKKPLKPLYPMVDGKAPTPKVVTKKTWIYMSAGFGTVMFIFLSLLPFLIGYGGGDIWASAISGLTGGIIGGIGFGFFMWFFLGRRKKGIAS